MNIYDDLFENEYKNTNKLINAFSFNKKMIGITSRLKSTVNPIDLRKIYTEVLLDDDCQNILLELSKEDVFLRDFPEFYIRNKYNENLINCTQNSTYHKYGVFKHTLVSIDYVGKQNKIYGDYEKTILKWTMLLHDLGKPYVKERNEDSHESFIAHEDMSISLAKEILTRFKFNNHDRTLILALICYHDKYLNEGEVIHDNLKELAHNLGGNKENFSLMISVKDADNFAKSDEVYENYKLTRLKYKRFLDNDFRDKAIIYKEEKELEDLSDEEYPNMLRRILNSDNVECSYQSIIDVDKKCIHGVEVFTNIAYEKKVNVPKLLECAKDNGKQETLEQFLFINALKDYDRRANKEKYKLFVNIDLNSYISYVNKARIYGFMKNYNMVIDFNSYNDYSSIEFGKAIELIHKSHGKVCLDGYILSKMSLENLKDLNVDYLKIDKSIIKDIDKVEERRKILADIIIMAFANDIEIIALGVETEEEYNTLNKLNIRYMQGYYFSKPNKDIVRISKDIINKISDEGNEKIV